MLLLRLLRLLLLVLLEEGEELLLLESEGVELVRLGVGWRGLRGLRRWRQRRRSLRRICCRRCCHRCRSRESGLVVSSASAACRAFRSGAGSSQGGLGL